MTPTVTHGSHQKNARPEPTSAAIPTLSPDGASLMWRTASTGLGAAKWAAGAGLLASTAGLGSGAVAGCVAGVAVLGSLVWIGEMASIRYGYELPHVTLQHALCNELHTLAGGLLGATPVAAGLTALAAALSTPNAAGTPETGYNGLAFLTAVVACPTMILLGAAARAVPVDPSSGIWQLLVHALPLLATGAVLVAPALALQAVVAPEAASRFVITFGAAMACAAVREGLTQASARAWSSVARDGFGASYGLSHAQGADRAASTVGPTALSCLLFATTTGLLLHQLDACYGLGMVPAGLSVLAMSAGEAARRTALRYTLLQSTNELLEGVARCLPLAAYARARGIPLAYRDDDDGMQALPALLRRKLADSETLRRAALFASARTMDGALSNVLSQLASAVSPGVYWNGYRVAAVLAQGATMARSPIVSAWLLPATEVDTDAGVEGDVVVTLPSDIEASADASAATSSPISDAALQWA